MEASTKLSFYRRLRSSLRALMVLILGFAIWLGYEVHLAREQAQAVAAIRAYGGKVAYDWQIAGDDYIIDGSPWAPLWLRRLVGDDFFQRVVLVNLVVGDGPDGEWIIVERMDDEIIESVGKLPDLTCLSLKGTQATDRAMGVVGKLGKLELLMMTDAAVSDAGIAQLKGLKALRILHATNAGLTDASLASLAALPRLTVLGLVGNRFTDRGLASVGGMVGLESVHVGMGETDITDAGVAHLRKLSKLENLSLQKTKITDAGLRELVGSKHLVGLWVNGTAVTQQGIDRLRAELPGLKVVER